MDGGSAARIARLAVAPPDPTQNPPAPHDFRLLEIGAGTGTLTQALLAHHSAVTALELDPDMVRVLRSRDDLAGATILQEDALAFDYAAFAAGGHWRVAGNLPYNIATPLLLRLIEMSGGPELVVAMIQRDVADRLVAQPATRAYGSLSIAVQYAARVERAFRLGPQAFYPRPKVDSTVVRIVRREEPAVRVCDEARFRQVARAAFAYRRKTLANSLSLALGLDRSAVANALRSLGLDTEIRGEQLGIADFARLADALGP